MSDENNEKIEDVDSLEGFDKETFNEFVEEDAGKDKSTKKVEKAPKEKEPEKEVEEEAEEEVEEEAEEEVEEDDKSIDSEIDKALKDEDVEDEGEETDLEFSEDSVISDEVRQGLIKLDKSTEIKDEVIQEFGDLLEKATKDGHSYVIEQFKKERLAAKKELYADPLMSKANLKTTRTNIEAAVKRFAGDDIEGMMKFFNSHHSYNANLVRFLNNIGAAVSEKATLGGASTPSNSAESAEAKALRLAKADNPAFFE